MTANYVCFIFLCISFSLMRAEGGPDRLREQAQLLENYEQAETNMIVDAVTQDLLSEDVLLQDAGCIILLKTLARLQEGDAEAQSIIDRLCADKKVIRAAAGIVDSRLLGWHNRECPAGNDDDFKPYIPLLHILGKADDKTAWGTLVRSFLYLHGRQDMFNGIPMREEPIAISLKRLKTIQQKLCCLYPGKDFVIEMLEKDSRYGMLDIFSDVLNENRNLSKKMKKEIKEFTADCLEYGDSKNGHVIRMKAAQVADILVKNGETDLLRKIEDLSKNDPYYVHKYDGKAGYSITVVKYPVRELCSAILIQSARF